MSMQAVRNFRTYFVRGLGALLPTIVTIWIFVQCYIFIQTKISVHINRGLVRLILWVSEGKWGNKEFLTDFWVEGDGKIAGFFVAVIGLVFIGAFLASVMGRTLWRIFENGLTNLPLVKTVYPYIKQITDFFLTKQDLSFRDVVALEYPRPGCWSIALVTGAGLRRLIDHTRREYLTLLVPTSPTPFTGYVVMVPKEETIALDMTIEEAIRFVISGGVITPAKHQAVKALVNKQDGEDV